MGWKDLRYGVKGSVVRTWVGWRDFRRNRRWCDPDRRFLVVRHAGKNPGFYDVIVQWAEEHVPEVRPYFELRLLPCRVRDWSRYVLHVPWLQDPVQRWSPRAYHQANRLAAQCDHGGIPVINRVDRLTNASKMEASHRLRAAGVNTPQMWRIDDWERFREHLLSEGHPLVIREELGHGGAMFRVDRREGLDRVPVRRLSRPVACPWIDVRDPRDGLYRKYRYLVAGPVGVPLHLQVTRDWIVRGTRRVYSKAARQEELAFVNGDDPHYELFQRARRALDLDILAFDYSYDRAGRIVIWEANPYPFLHFSQRLLSYLTPAMDASIAAIVRLYLERAGLAIPARMEEILKGRLRGTPPSTAMPVRRVQPGQLESKTRSLG